MATICLKDPMKIDLNIGHQLTSNSCGHVLVEIIKFIAYQRLQIPYTYQWLKQLINNRKTIEGKKEGYQSERHYHLASTALMNLDFILKSVLKEVNSAILPEEICIALGATPVTCKEFYRFLLPSYCHKPQCQSVHIASDQKIQRNVFKSLATSDDLNKVFFNSLPPTNMYILIKKKLSHNQNIVCSDDYVFIRGYRIPRNCNVVNVNFRSKNAMDIDCCNNFPVFSDLAHDLNHLNIKKDKDDVDFHEIESSDEIKWFQSTYVMKGFKDCLVNGHSVTNSWTQS